MCAAHQNPGAAVGGADFEDKDLDAVQGHELLTGNLLFFIEHAVGLAQVHTHVLADVALYNAGDDITLFLYIIIVNYASLFFSDLLHDHVLGDLRGDSSESAAVNVDTDSVPHLGGGNDFNRVFKGDILETVHHILGKLDNCLLCIAGEIKGVAVNLYLDVLRPSEVALAGSHQRVFDRFEKCVAAYILFLFKGENGLFQISVHTVSFC